MSKRFVRDALTRAYTLAGLSGGLGLLLLIPECHAALHAAVDRVHGWADRHPGIAYPVILAATGLALSLPWLLKRPPGDRPPGNLPPAVREDIRILSQIGAEEVAGRLTALAAMPAAEAERAVRGQFEIGLGLLAEALVERGLP